MVFDPCVCYELVCLPHCSGVRNTVVCASQCTRGMATPFIENKDKAPQSVLFLSHLLKAIWPHGGSECGWVGFFLSFTMWTRTALSLFYLGERKGAVIALVTSGSSSLHLQWTEALSDRCCVVLCFALTCKCPRASEVCNTVRVLGKWDCWWKAGCWLRYVHGTCAWGLECASTLSVQLLLMHVGAVIIQSGVDASCISQGQAVASKPSATSLHTNLCLCSVCMAFLT